MRRRIVAAVILAAVVAALGWGYWHATSHADLYISINDVSQKNERQAYGRLLAADIVLLDDRGATLARGRAVEPLGIVSVVHPQVGDCIDAERKASMDDAGRNAWQRCFATLSRWISTWASEVRYASIVVPECRIERARVINRAYRDDWWLWWVPLPHIGGAPYTHFDLSVTIDRAACRPAG